MNLFRTLFGIESLECRILCRLNEIKEEIIMAGQASIDAATAAFTSMEADDAAQVAQLIADFGALTTLIQNLPASVDTTALDAALAKAQATAKGLDPAVASITGLTPPPAPPAG